MHYEGIFCRLVFDESVLSYTSSKSANAALFWGKFNHRVEVPVNAIIDMKIDSYLPFGRGLTLKIKSGYHYEKVKTLTPMNITAVPNRVIKELQSLVEKNRQRQTTVTVS